MFQLLGKLSRHIWLALFWSILTQVLLCLPGNIFPGHGLFSIPYLDKIAHLFLFSGLVFCWSLFFYFRKRPPAISFGHVWTIVFLVFFYGVVMEFFQKAFIPNRSFDGGDIIADLAGGFIGYIVTQWFIRKSNRHQFYKIN